MKRRGPPYTGGIRLLVLVHRLGLGLGDGLQDGGVVDALVRVAGDGGISALALGRGGRLLVRTVARRASAERLAAAQRAAGALAAVGRARRVRTAVLAMRDAEVRVVGLGLDVVDRLERVRDVGEVDERAVPVALHGVFVAMWSTATATMIRRARK